MLQKCNHCKYTWDYKGKRVFYATCPMCLYKVRIMKEIGVRPPVLADISPITDCTPREVDPE
jgi:hypothetical protein